MVFIPNQIEFKYYVYAYIRCKDSKIGKIGTPYYIGKGCGERAWSKSKSEIQIPSDNKYIIILENNLSNIGAFALERRYIEWYGRIDLNTGILRNKSSGGDGVSNPIFSESRRKDISERRKGTSVFKDNTGKKFTVSVNDSRVVYGELVGVNSGISRNKHGKICYRDSDNNFIKTSKDDEKVKSGELIPFSSGVSYYRDEFGKLLCLSKYDEKVISGSVTSVHKNISKPKGEKSKIAKPVKITLPNGSTSTTKCLKFYCDTNNLSYGIAGHILRKGSTTKSGKLKGYLFEYINNL